MEESIINHNLQSLQEKANPIAYNMPALKKRYPADLYKVSILEKTQTLYHTLGQFSGPSRPLQPNLNPTLNSHLIQ